ncbi:serine hydrolase [Gemmatimonas sp.]|uniref:serine hydrolase n=1 Tax=Gemmatimonas sp. TaxID=1962908 RepID=UPI0031F2D5F3
MVLDAIEPLGAYAAIQQEILTPLQLYATAQSVSTKIERLVVGYDGERSMFGQDAMMSNGALIYNPQFEWGGGGFASTPTDLANFMTAFRRGRIFPDSLWIIAIAKPNGVAAEVHQWRGMGVHVDSTSLGSAYGHSGFMPGYVSWVRWYEKLGVSVAMQVNASDEARLIDDGFDWVDSVAAITSLHCRAR